MSRFLSEKYKTLEAYVPGEQPKDRKYIKLNTNESPFSPSPGVISAAKREASLLQLYCDPECRELRKTLSAFLGKGITPEHLLMTNGSDEALELAFSAFGDRKRPLAFPDISYGFYPVFAEMLGIPYLEIPLREDFSVGTEDYAALPHTVVLANPNSPTGIAVSPEKIEVLLKSDPDRIVIVDEAYVDFGGESCLPLISRYDNLLVIRTFSKSRSLAGGRLGFAAGDPSLIADMNLLKYSKNPYNVNRMTQAAGIAAIEENEYYAENCRKIIGTRERTAAALRALGFTVLPSKTNFLFAKHEKAEGAALYISLREKGILVRHFSKPRIENFLRITVGSDEQMDALLSALHEILTNGENP